ncbi:hypothetical protein KJ761_00210 [Patescibacteria group bacterium]|nr:hypothetical protein [Patescibacteria group bacterium]
MDFEKKEAIGIVMNLPTANMRNFNRSTTPSMSSIVMLSSAPMSSITMTATATTREITTRDGKTKKHQHQCCYQSFYHVRILLSLKKVVNKELSYSAIGKL